MGLICPIPPKATSGAMFTMGITSIRRGDMDSSTTTTTEAAREGSGRRMGVGRSFISGEGQLVGCLTLLRISKDNGKAVGFFFDVLRQLQNSAMTADFELQPRLDT